MGYLIVTTLFLLAIALPVGLLYWFVSSLYKYVKATKEARMLYRGSLVASSATLVIFVSFAIWFTSIGTKTISLM